MLIFRMNEKCIRLLRVQYEWLFFIDLLLFGEYVKKCSSRNYVNRDLNFAQQQSRCTPFKPNRMQCNNFLGFLLNFKVWKHCNLAWWANAMIGMGKRLSKVVITCPDLISANCAFVTTDMPKDAKQFFVHHRKHANRSKSVARAVNSSVSMTHWETRKRIPISVCD